MRQRIERANEKSQVGNENIGEVQMSMTAERKEMWVNVSLYFFKEMLWLLG